MAEQINGQPSLITPNLPDAISIISSTNATPIVITSDGAHLLTTGDSVIITDHLVNIAANGIWTVVVISPTTFSLTGSAGVGVGGATGQLQGMGYGSTYAIPDDGDGIDAASVGVGFEALADRTAFAIEQIRWRGLVDVFDVAQDTTGNIETASSTSFADATNVTATITKCLVNDVLRVRLTAIMGITTTGADYNSAIRLVAVDDLNGVPQTATILTGARTLFSEPGTTSNAVFRSVSIAGKWIVARAGDTKIKLQLKAGASGTVVFLEDAFNLTVERFRARGW